MQGAGGHATCARHRLRPLTPGWLPAGPGGKPWTDEWVGKSDKSGQWEDTRVSGAGAGARRPTNPDGSPAGQGKWVEKW